MAEASFALKNRRTPPLGSASKSARLDFIDALRGIAVLSVFIFHVWMLSGCPLAYWWNPLLTGYAGVNLFLLLSGFCLYWPYVKEGRLRDGPSLGEFAYRRARRILPPYYAAAVLCAIGALVLPRFGIAWEGSAATPAASEVGRSLAWHALMLHNLRPEYIFSLAGPFWSLALEVQLYVAMPLLVVLARRRGIASAVLLAAVVTFSYRIAMDRLVGGPAGWASLGGEQSFVLCYQLPGKWLEFALGMLAAHLVAKGVPANTAAPYGSLSLGLLTTGAFVGFNQTKFGPFSDALLSLGFFFLLLRWARTTSRETAIIPRPSISHPLAHLGTFSYSVYMLHWPILALLVQWHGFAPLQSRWKMGIAIVLFLPIILLCSYLFHCAFERPFMNSRDNRRKSRPPVFVPLRRPRTPASQITAELSHASQ